MVSEPENPRSISIVVAAANHLWTVESPLTPRSAASRIVSIPHLHRASQPFRHIPNRLRPASSSCLAAVPPHPKPSLSRIFIATRSHSTTQSVSRRLVAASASHASSCPFLFRSVSIREAPVYAAEIRASQTFCLYSSVVPSRTQLLFQSWVQDDVYPPTPPTRSDESFSRLSSIFCLRSQSWPSVRILSIIATQPWRQILAANPWIQSCSRRRNSAATQPWRRSPVTNLSLANLSRKIQ